MRCKLTPPSGAARFVDLRDRTGSPGGLVYSSRLPAGQPVETPLSRKRERRSSVRRIHRDVARELAFPAGAVVEELVLVVEQLLAGLDRELVVRPLDDGVDRTGFLAEAAIDALHHVDVVAGGAAGAVVPARPGLDGDRLRRADRLAELAGDAALLAVRVASKGVLASEPRRAVVRLEGVVDGRLRPEEVLQREPEGGNELPQEDRAGGLVELHGPDSLGCNRRDVQELQDEGYDDDGADRDRQEDLPAEPHELVVAVARHDRLH